MHKKRQHKKAFKRSSESGYHNSKQRILPRDSSRRVRIILQVGESTGLCPAIRASAVGRYLEANLSRIRSGYLTKHKVLKSLGKYTVSIGNWSLSLHVESTSCLTQRDREGTREDR